LKAALKQEVFLEDKNKILVVTHSRVLQSFSASGVEANQGPEISSVGPDELVGARYYHNCEVVPYFSE
jgi:hypothetical protein